VFKLDLRHDDLLDNVRDNLLLDYGRDYEYLTFRLKLEDLSDGYINIRTLKTKTWVSLPVHEQIEMILNKEVVSFLRKYLNRTLINTLKQFVN
jgi:hypothetical protein